MESKSITMETKMIQIKKQERIEENNSLFFLACKEIVGEEIFNKWFLDIEIYSQTKNEIILSSPSKFKRDWINREYFQAKTFIKSLNKTLPDLHKINIIFLEKNIELPKDNENKSSQDNKIVNLSKYDNVFAFATELNNKFTFTNFISAKYCKMALSMAKIVAGFDNQLKIFDDKIPLFIHGGVGIGKTHLAQSIAWFIKENDKTKKVVYLSAEKFMYHFVQSIRSNDIMNFKEKMRSIDVLIVDDVQFIAGKDGTQQEFMNCFNSLVEDNKQVILVCDRCPSNLENIDEKLKSRITGGMIINLKKPDFSDRLLITKQKIQSINYQLPEEVINLIAEKITSSIRDIEGALKKLMAENIFAEQEITIESSKSILSSYLKKSDNAVISIEKIQKIVAEFYNLRTSDLTSKNRSKNTVKARQVAMYLSKTHTKSSLPIIGEKFGGKNHATVIHSIKIINNAISQNNNFSLEIKTIEEKIIT